MQKKTCAKHLQNPGLDTKHLQKPDLQNPGFDMLGAEARRFKPAYAKAILDKSGQNPGKNEIFVSPTHDRKTANNEITN